MVEQLLGEDAHGVPVGRPVDAGQGQAQAVDVQRGTEQPPQGDRAASNSRSALSVSAWPTDW